MDDKKAILQQDCTDTHGVRTWIVCISGFTQRFGQHTGVHRLWLRLRRLFSSPQTQVELYPWASPWDEIAELIKISANGRPPRVCIIGYSWGAGWGFVRLARELAARGIQVHRAVLCDPVYRSRWLTFQWRSLFGRPRIKVPTGVRSVTWLYQRAGKPCGHELVAEDPRTVIRAGLDMTPIEHSSMDECFDFYQLAVEAAGDTLI